MKSLLSIVFAVSLSFLSVGCGKTEGGESSKTDVQSMKALDLSSHGIPVSIKAPEGATVEPSTLTIEKGVSVKKDKYNVLVDLFIETADPSKDAKLVKQHQLEDDKTNEAENGFKIILDEPQGYIYETNDKEIGRDFHFYYVTFKGDQQIEFTPGLSLFENYTEADIRAMYESVKQ